ncbi:MAG: response regulator [Desulfuromonadaceae bacterium]|nr:response regulator [Desulfuromonadaceae bacterium]
MNFQNVQHTTPADTGMKPEVHRVLVVDDEPALRFAYGRLLESELFNVDICETIEDALALLKTNHYFAVISDVRFAGPDNTDGLYFVSEVRKEQPLSEVILVTGYGSEELEKTTRKLGASHYFEKPVEPSLILSLLRSLHLIADKRDENSSFNSLLMTKALVS